jgi:fructuronate reductase
VDAYIDAILARFANPAVQHRLAQIAQDGSQKIPVRLLGTIADALAAGRNIEVLCLPVAAWLQFVRRQARAGVALSDPMAERLGTIGRSMTGEPVHDMRLALALNIFEGLSANDQFVSQLTLAFEKLNGTDTTLIKYAISSSG